MATASDSLRRPRSLAGVGHGIGMRRTTGPPVDGIAARKRPWRTTAARAAAGFAVPPGPAAGPRRDSPGRRPGGGARRRAVGRALGGEQTAPGGVTVHGFSCSWRAASRLSSFCRALKTRQRAVSSVRSSTSAISRNDSPCSARSSRAARKSAGSRPRARARSASASRPCASSSGSRLLGRQVVGQRLALAGRAMLVGEVVVGDPEQPGGEVRARPETIQAGERLEERLLGQVLGRMAVVRQVVQPAIKAVPVAFDQHGEGGPVALLGGADQPLFVGRRVGWFAWRGHGDALRGRVGTTSGLYRGDAGAARTPTSRRRPPCRPTGDNPDRPDSLARPPPRRRQDFPIELRPYMK